MRVVRPEIAEEKPLSQTHTQDSIMLSLRMHKSSRNFKIFFASGGAAQAAGAKLTQNPEPPLAGPERD